MFAWDLVDLLQIRSAIWYQMDQLMKVVPYDPVPVSNQPRVNRVDPYLVRCKLCSVFGSYPVSINGCNDVP